MGAEYDAGRTGAEGDRLRGTRSVELWQYSSGMKLKLLKVVSHRPSPSSKTGRLMHLACGAQLQDIDMPLTVLKPGIGSRQCLWELVRAAPHQNL